MKNTSAPKKRRTKGDTMRREYRFDYSKARLNRFSEEISEGVVAVVLDPDVAAVFKSSQDVNTFLRSVIAALPESKQ
jgi:hypothetical protein